ncbi:hypothetical protein QCA50_014146 [Cerrena zonata]|uniref:Uncharacterized protein n=1 Tax=Cerrena zonata TaxID=2478898 RepID=A0AAW0FM94_9APHY
MDTLDSSFATGLVECISISNILYGITFAQFYVYTQNWERDPKWLKCLAIFVILLETAYTACIQRTQYFYSLLAIDDRSVLANIDWSISVVVFISGIAEFIIQGFYVYRMWIFSRNVPLLIGTVSFNHRSQRWLM